MVDESADDFEKKKSVILVIGVNGVGKTTTIGKLAAQYKKSGKKVLIAAADTFRAAAIDQLKTWADRAGVEMISHNEGADPGLLDTFFQVLDHLFRCLISHISHDECLFQFFIKIIINMGCSKHGRKTVYDTISCLTESFF